MTVIVFYQQDCCQPHQRDAAVHVSLSSIFNCQRTDSKNCQNFPHPKPEGPSKTRPKTQSIVILQSTKPFVASAPPLRCCEAVSRPTPPICQRGF
ncbi:hypothetical protein FS782_26140, partial [Agrobacterium vitis]|nr:hypothetical protein [Agrobacterium vitis]